MNRAALPWIEPTILTVLLSEKLGRNGLIWLDSDNSPAARWSTLGLNPIQTVRCHGLPDDLNAQNPFIILEKLKVHGGHWTGWLSYEAGAWVEPSSYWCRPQMAILWAAWHDPVLKFDHHCKELWLEGQNNSRFKSFFSYLNILIDNIKNKFLREEELIYKIDKSEYIPIKNWNWHTNPKTFGEQVIKLRKLIAIGDIFQANLTACCSVNLNKHIDPVGFYLLLRNYCPAPFGGLIIGGTNLEEEIILSTSMERFLSLSINGNIETRPIKGTRPRHKDLIDDAIAAVDLISSPKDRAENLMIVDLLRNDLGKVCKPGSINVPQLLSLESYKRVHHLTSVVKGKLSDNCGLVELIKACWPGGSISGAPKLRAIQRLNELEPVSRGPYCGSLFRITPEGDFDSNLLIRSVMAKGQLLSAHAGCGIVADSDPEEETKELGWKLYPLLKALAGDS
uniref:Possible p-aminobenzoate synthetase n=1 Tax=Paulinella chromatophora TaxID=39717 RepID=B1X4F8_PAUCH|nr:possible p-aminobenzoate synthetase [Paulinella chromatophora]ACB42827.1 possible p-aminobenzoate synthetase [Paulinella chromatophora]